MSPYKVAAAAAIPVGSGYTLIIGPTWVHIIAGGLITGVVFGRGAVNAATTTRLGGVTCSTW